jgi:polyhydroxybutyrate depolymerase
MITRNLVCCFAITSLTISCSGTDSSSAAGNGGTSAANAGGQVGTGGNATGGANVSLGGSVSSGGSVANTGGAPANTGGAPANTGGAPANTGGAPANTGGAPANTGGASSGTGGKTSNTGGAPSATGGSSGVGGSTAGGASGCGVPGAATGVQNLQISVAGQTRDYVLFVPTTYNSSTVMPLIFAWHGLGGSGTLARQYFRIEQAASNQAIFVYPTGLPNSSGQAAWTLTETGVDIQFFDALRADIASKYCIDLNRVYAAGHSYGAMMTNALGCYRGNVLRAIAPVAGMPPFGNPTCKGAVAAWIAHGDNDPTVDFTTGGIASRDLWIRLDTCDASATPVAVDPSPCVAYQGCSSGHPVHWCVHQDQHNWPTFAGAGIWAFFNALK